MGRRTSPLSEGTIWNLAAGAGFGHLAILRALLPFDLSQARVARRARVDALTIGSLGGFFPALTQVSG